MGRDARIDLADALLADDSPWVACRVVFRDADVADFEFVLANDAAVAAVGVGPLVGGRMLELVPEVHETLFPLFVAAVQRGQGRVVRMAHVPSPSRPHWAGGWVEYAVRVCGDLVVVHWRDVTQDHEDNLAVQASESRFRALVENAGDVVSLVTRDGTVTYVSPAIRRVLGSEVPSQHFTDRIHPEDVQLAQEVLTVLAQGEPGEVAELEIRMRHDTGHWLWISARGTNHLHEPTVQGIVINWRDITEQRQLQDRLRHQALHDVLTGLPNRRLLNDHLQLALARSQRTGRGVGVIYCDIDHFKTVNDTLGHAAGDDLLLAVGERLRASLRPPDTVARIGGDEFVLVCEDLEDDYQAAALAHRVQELVRGSYRLHDREVQVSLTMGVSVGRHPLPAAQLLSDADRALYEAKRRGRDRYEMFSPQLHSRHRDRRELAHELGHALDEGQLVLHYQPVVDLRTGAALGAEALLRWEHPDRGLLLPAHFLPAAESSDLVVRIDAWVMREAMTAAAAWPSVNGSRGKVYVNVSGRHLVHADLLRHVEDALAGSGLDPALAELEITETVLLGDLYSARRALHEIRRHGVGIALDDFGTGYSSLAWLQHLPVDTVKVDRELVTGIGTSAHGTTVVSAVISLAHALGYRVVAEGVELESQRTRLLELGCELAQGYLFGAPAAGVPAVAAPVRPD